MLEKLQSNGIPWQWGKSVDWLNLIWRTFWQCRSWLETYFLELTLQETYRQILPLSVVPGESGASHSIGPRGVWVFKAPLQWQHLFIPSSSAQSQASIFKNVIVRHHVKQSHFCKQLGELGQQKSTRSTICQSLCLPLAMLKKSQPLACEGCMVVDNKPHSNDNQYLLCTKQHSKVFVDRNP